jgi:lysophospholipase L1-like esterase
VAVVAIFGTQSTYAAGKSKLKFVDAATLTIINKIDNDCAPFARINAEKYEARKSLGATSTGLAIVFRTDSRIIDVKWSTTKKKIGNNSTPILQSGLDLYIRDEGEWIFAGAARPTFNSNDHLYTAVKRTADGIKECMLYLPMHIGVTSLEIGVEKSAMIEPMASPFKYKIVFVGSSITHGSSASRPGATYVARFGRELNAEMANIGLSGQCKLDDYFANIVCENTADAFIFDTFSNSTAEIIEERLDNFVKRVATAHPDKPLIFLQTIKRDIGYFDLGARKRNDDQRAAAEKGMARLCKKYKNVYFINPGIILGDNHEGTVDGTHLNDLGVQCTMDYLLPKLKKILKKYGVK